MNQLVKSVESFRIETSDKLVSIREVRPLILNVWIKSDTKSRGMTYKRPCCHGGLSWETRSGNAILAYLHGIPIGRDVVSSTTSKKGEA